MYDPIRDLPTETASSEGADNSNADTDIEPQVRMHTSSEASADQPTSSSQQTTGNAKQTQPGRRSDIERSSEDMHVDSKRAGSERPPKRAAPDTEERPSSRSQHSPAPKKFKADSPQQKKERRDKDPSPIRRSPSPPARSPPRQRKRPGAASRIDATSKEAMRQRQLEREAEQLAASRQVAVERGSHDIVKQHYNAVPQRGREWRRTDSKIKNLRSFNNWIKSVLIQKFSPNEDFSPGTAGRGRSSTDIAVLDVGCGKGGDLGKWQKAPQRVGIYIGVDPAEVSIDQARERYEESAKRSRGRIFEGHFIAKDGYGEWLGDIPIVRTVGIDREVGPGSSSRWGNSGFDVVTMMFCMHYAFESEELARGMLRNVAGALKKGGRFIGVIPNSDIIRQHVEDYHKEKEKSKDSNADQSGKEDGEIKDDILTWGNDVYTVRFPGETPADGIFRPPFGWKYSYFMAEAVEAPEYVVPFEAFRALAEDYNLEMQYRKPFHDVWKEERDDPELGELSVRMGVTRTRGGEAALSQDEWEAVGFYHAFCFYKV